MKRIENIQRKPWVRHGKTYQPSPEMNTYNAEIQPGKQIRIYGIYRNLKSGEKEFSSTFKIGDEAEYDSYNLIYTGKIINIGAKTITIEAYPGTHNAERHRLDLYEFCWRNWDFDLDRISKHNLEESLCI